MAKLNIYIAPGGMGNGARPSPDRGDRLDRDKDWGGDTSGNYIKPNMLYKAPGEAD